MRRGLPPGLRREEACGEALGGGSGAPRRVDEEVARGARGLAVFRCASPLTPRFHRRRHHNEDNPLSPPACARVRTPARAPGQARAGYRRRRGEPWAGDRAGPREPGRTPPTRGRARRCGGVDGACALPPSPGPPPPVAADSKEEEDAEDAEEAAARAAPSPPAPLDPWAQESTGLLTRITGPLLYRVGRWWGWAVGSAGLTADRKALDTRRARMLQVRPSPAFRPPCRRRTNAPPAFVLPGSVRDSNPTLPSSAETRPKRCATP